jgi:hypothetical protein
LVPFCWLTQFYLFIALTAMHRVLGAAVANREMPTCPRMWQGVWRSIPPMRKHKLRERGNKLGAPPVGRRKGGGWTPSRSGSSGEGEGEREKTLPPLSSQRITLPLFRDIVCWSVGTAVNVRRLKCPCTGTRPQTNSPRWLHLTQVTSNHEERDEHSKRGRPSSWQGLG